MNYAHYKVRPGTKAHEACRRFMETRGLALAAIDNLIAQHNATPGHVLWMGDRVEGLHFRGPPPAPWKPSRQFPGYATPDVRKTGGKALRESLFAYWQPSAEDLARELGCPPFFRDFDTGRQYCASIGVMESRGVYYLQASRWCPPSLDVIEQIPASEWHKADEDRAAAEKGAKS